MGDLKFWYPSSITQITSVNESFDSCQVRICYAGRNRNFTEIPKAAIEKAMPTIAYCPIVANYDVETDAIGGHDVGIAEGADGTVRMINMTDAVGVIPENPQWQWESVAEEDGSERQYLNVSALLWKRTPVYDKLKREGVSGQSMEIRVKSGRVVDDYMVIDDFEFNAFCLLGDSIEPCFESAQVQLFQKDDLPGRVQTMMGDYKARFNSVMTASADDINSPNGDDNGGKGGDVSLNLNELYEKYGLSESDVDVDISGMPVEEIEQLFEKIAAGKQATFADGDGDNSQAGAGNTNEGAGNEPAAEPAAEPVPGATNDGETESAEEEPEEDDDADEDNLALRKRGSYALLAEQVIHGLCEALHQIRYTDDWGEFNRYSYIDFDMEAGEVFAYDNAQGGLYGFHFTMNGDNPVIDFDSAKRKKVSYVDFDEGEPQPSFKGFAEVAEAKFAALESEVRELRAYKAGIEKAEREAKENELFSRFADLYNSADFIALKENCKAMSLQEIEDKCYAIRGRNVQVKFSQDESSQKVRIPVERKAPDAGDEPYGGVFVKFGIGVR